MRKTWLIFTQAVTVALAVLFVVTTLKPEWLNRPGASNAPNVVSVTSAPALPAAAKSEGTLTSYSAAARRATPAVVSITASKAPARGPHTNDPWFQFFFGDGSRQNQDPQIGLGSGVIVSTAGYLLTIIRAFSPEVFDPLLHKMDASLGPLFVRSGRPKSACSMRSPVAMVSAR